MRIYLAVVFLAVVNAKPNGKTLVNKDNGLEYMLVYQSQPWERARDKCNEAGMKLAVPRSQQEFSFLQNIVRGMQYRKISNNNQYKLLVWLGINNLDNFTVWKTIDGDDIKESAFTKSLNEEGFSDSPSEPHCVGMDAQNPGLRTYWCNRYQPYICQSDTTTNIVTNS